MSIKLDTYITKENKISKKQYPISVSEEINKGLLHQVVTSNRTNHRIIQLQLKQELKFQEQERSHGLKKEQVEQDRDL